MCGTSPDELRKLGYEHGVGAVDYGFCGTSRGERLLVSSDLKYEGFFRNTISPERDCAEFSYKFLCEGHGRSLPITGVSDENGVEIWVYSEVSLIDTNSP